MDADYKVSLDIFEGPLDLLLYLIKKDEIDIYDISIDRITKQYLEYMETFKMLNIDLASEFIVMAANLMYIKSRTLLPRHQQPPDEEAEEEDPRWELIRQLIEYKKFKDAAGYLHDKAEEQSNLFPHTPDERKDEESEGPRPLAELGIFDLIRAFQNVLDRFEEEHSLGEIVDDRFTVSDQIDHLLSTVPPGGAVKFLDVFSELRTKGEVIVTFLAVLELMKLRYFRINQEGVLGEIELFRNENL
ncbi:MAG: segregation/condensation protein A [Verrucomicrobiota bacterium]